MKFETTETDVEVFKSLTSEVLKLNAKIDLVAPGQLPRDGVVIADLR